MKNNIQNSNNYHFPIIDLGDYILREQTVEDAEDFLHYYSDPEVSKYIVSFIPSNLDEAINEIKYWINVFKYRDGIYFAIATKDSNKMIGSIGVSGINRTHNRIEASYDLAKEYWNKGIMTKALQEVVKYVFNNFNINRIEAFAMSQNNASCKILKKCGFNFEGNLRQHRFHNGKYVDIGIFSIIYQDWLLLQNNN